MDVCVYIFLFSSTNLVPIIFPHNMNEEEERESRKNMEMMKLMAFELIRSPQKHPFTMANENI